MSFRYTYYNFTKLRLKCWRRLPRSKVIFFGTVLIKERAFIGWIGRKFALVKRRTSLESRISNYSTSRYYLSGSEGSFMIQNKFSRVFLSIAMALQSLVWWMELEESEDQKTSFDGVTLSVWVVLAVTLLIILLLTLILF